MVEAITIIANDEVNPDHTSGLESKAWYKTIVVNLKRAAENSQSKYQQLLGKPFASAELLLGNNYASFVWLAGFIEASGSPESKIRIFLGYIFSFPQTDNV